MIADEKCPECGGPLKLATPKEFIPNYVAKCLGCGETIGKIGSMVASGKMTIRCTGYVVTPTITINGCTSNMVTPNITISGPVVERNGIIPTAVVKAIADSLGIPLSVEVSNDLDQIDTEPETWRDRKPML